MKRYIISLSACWVLLVAHHVTAQAQEANNPLLYSNQAIQFSDIGVSHDPVTLVMPGVAFSGGFGSYLDNPASAALFKESFTSFGLAFRNVNETADYLENSMSFDDNQTGLSNLGFVYRFPTVRGSLVVGAGYNQHSFHNRAMSVSGRNELSTMTDMFKMPGSPYGDIAWSAFAIDEDVMVDPVSGDEIFWDESIFRVGFPQFGDYAGVRQEGEILQRGYGGDYSAFLATEFLQNLMVGVSVGIRSGRFSYERQFIEIDEFNDYNSDFIETDDGGTDIDTILLTDEIRSDYISFSSRIGAIYRIGNLVNIGASYTLPSRLSVTEEFDARIASTFDNGVIFEDELFNEYTYSVSSPGCVGLGAAITDLGGLSASFSAEYVDHGNTRLHFDAGEFEQQREENQFIEDTYGKVWNLRGGLSYDFNSLFSLRAGYGHRPSRFRNIELDRHQISAGAGVALGRSARLELGAQYTMWDEDQSVVYEYGDLDYSVLPDQAPVTYTGTEFAAREVNRLQVMATLRLMFR